MTEHLLHAIVVEDDYLLAEALADSLVKLDYAFVSSVGTLEDGLKALDVFDVDLAVVDINLHGEDAYPLLDVLIARRTALVLATSSSQRDIPDRFCGVPLVNKPYSRPELYQAIRSLRVRQSS